MGLARSTFPLFLGHPPLYCVTVISRFTEAKQLQIMEIYIKVLEASFV
jgi:hypothetical protein